jgi:hypothetical protein
MWPVLRVVVGVVTALMPGTFLHATEQPLRIPVDDYALYDHVVTSKFLTSETRLVVVERMTVARLVPNEEGPMTTKQFQEQGYFDGGLSSDLMRDFVGVNQEPSRLEGRFQFAARYRFVSGNGLEEPEVRMAVPVATDAMAWARGTEAPPVLDRLAFSRVGRTLRNDQALVYVENLRPDGTGAGFLVWFHRQGKEWTRVDTEVVWTVRHQETENPLLAP